MNTNSNTTNMMMMSNSGYQGGGFMPSSSMNQQGRAMPQLQQYGNMTTTPRPMINIGGAGVNGIGGGGYVDQGLVRLRIVALLKGHDGILGAQLPSKYLETYGSALYLEAADGSKIKLKEYLLSDEMMQLLANYQGERLRLVLVKAGHDRKYSIVVDS